MAAVALAALLHGGCLESEYLGPYTVATPPDMGGGGGEEEEAVTPATRLTFQFRDPSDSEQQARAREAEEKGYEIPFPKLGQVTFEIDYVVKNLSDEASSVMVAIDGASTYGAYDEAQVMVGEDEAAPPPLLSAFHRLEAGESATGVFSEEDFREAGIDLDTINRFSGDGTLPEAAILNSARDTEIGLGDRALGELLEDSPAFTELLVKLVASGPAALEFTLRLTDRLDVVDSTTVESLATAGPTYAP